MDLKRLFCLRGKQQIACYSDRASYVKLCYLFKIIDPVIFKDDLQILKAAPVVQFHKPKRLGIADRLYPSGYGHFLFLVSTDIIKQRFDLYSCHTDSPVLFRFFQINEVC